jgi:hypothetical protein
MTTSDENRNERQDASRFDGEEHHGWSPDVGAGGSERATEANRKAFQTPPGDRGPGAEESEEERSGVPPTDTDADTPLGVGTSSAKRAEQYGAEGENGRRTVGTQGEAERPYGVTDPDEDTSVGAQAPIDPESPYLPPN